MPRIFTSCLFAYCLVASSAGASETITALDLEEYCKAAPGLDAGYCLGFMYGYSAGIINARTLSQYVCLESGVTPEQMRRIFIKFTEGRPEVLNQSAELVAAAAMAEAFPCPSK